MLPETNTIRCEASSIGKTEEMPAHTALLSHIAAYFKSACSDDDAENVVMTDLPPVYFQHHGSWLFGHTLSIRWGTYQLKRNKINRTFYDNCWF